MNISIDPDSAVPIYLQVVNAIKHHVAAGQLAPGQQLPTVRQLATDLRVNPNTIARAYDLLDTDRVITTQQGRGTYVREQPDQEQLRRARQEQLTSLMDSLVGKALSMGYSAREVREALEAQLARWSKPP
ncbi:MAG TPA: GntR family transcriptional regulator [Anaerolineae bacterium]